MKVRYTFIRPSLAFGFEDSHLSDLHELSTLQTDLYQTTARYVFFCFLEGGPS